MACCLLLWQRRAHHTNVVDQCRPQASILLAAARMNFADVWRYALSVNSASGWLLCRM